MRILKYNSNVNPRHDIGHKIYALYRKIYRSSYNHFTFFTSDVAYLINNLKELTFIYFIEPDHHANLIVFNKTDGYCKFIFDTEIEELERKLNIKIR